MIATLVQQVSPKYLVVDDHEPLRRLIRSFLPGSNPQVIECENGIQALEVYAKEKPDWVLMDIKMPGGDGLTAARTITQQFPEANIIIVTCLDERPLREKAFQCGARAFVLKSDLPQIEKVIQQLPSIHS